ncbi:hypothetical protein Y032_0836g2601 [Ancylostoma ceylanicum]|nr:hypothetical protein Y032_0836g2601 [Ancylostoma ceylanicum]
MLFRVLFVLLLISGSLGYVVWPQLPDGYRSDSYGNILIGDENSGFFLTVLAEVVTKSNGDSAERPSVFDIP